MFVHHINLFHAFNCHKNELYYHNYATSSCFSVLYIIGIGQNYSLFVIGVYTFVSGYVSNCKFNYMNIIIYLIFLFADDVTWIMINDKVYDIWFGASLLSWSLVNHEGSEVLHFHAWILQVVNLGEFFFVIWVWWRNFP